MHHPTPRSAKQHQKMPHGPVSRNGTASTTLYLDASWGLSHQPPHVIPTTISIMTHVPPLRLHGVPWHSIRTTQSVQLGIIWTMILVSLIHLLLAPEQGTQFTLLMRQVQSMSNLVWTSQERTIWDLRSRLRDMITSNGKWYPLDGWMCADFGIQSNSTKLPHDLDKIHGREFCQPRYFPTNRLQYNHQHHSSNSRCRIICQWDVRTPQPCQPNTRWWNGTWSHPRRLSVRWWP